MPRLLPLFASLLATAISAYSLTNADVIQMTEAKLDEQIILASIQNSEAKFDVSATGLIQLSNAKVPQAIITTMIKRMTASPAPTPSSNGTAAATAPAAPGSELMSPSEVLFDDNGKVTPMKYLNPQMRTAARALGFGGVASYAVLRGTSATFRTSNFEPSFIVSVPNQAQPDSYITLASFAVRPNGSREVMVGGGYMSYSTGVHPDRVVPVKSDKLEDQSKAQKGFTIYRVTPARKLTIGQYAVILYTGEMQGLVGSWFTGTGNSYFDFGVESPKG